MSALRRVKSVANGLKYFAIARSLYPRWMYLMVDQCNSRCRTCNIWQQKPCDNPITPEQLKSILESELFKNTEYFGITGGEPTLFNLIGYLKVAHTSLPNAMLSVSSNGLLPDKLYSTVDLCLWEGMQINVGLSLDGIGEFHDRWRGVTGNFEKVDWLVHKFIELQRAYPKTFSFGVGSTLTVETAKQTDQLLAYTRKLNVPFLWHWYNHTPFYHNKLRQEDSKLFESAILKLMKPSPYRDSWVEYLHTGKFPHVRCQALSNYFLLNCDGVVKPCLTLWNENVGNMLKDDPVKVWYSKEANQVRSKIASCQGCLNKWACDWNVLASAYPKYILKRATTRLTSHEN